MDPILRHWIGHAGRGQETAVANFSATDAKEVCKLVRRNESLVEKKRRYLLSMCPGPDGRIKRMKQPKFMKELYLAESYVRWDELSCERVKAYVKRCYGLECNECCHHVVQDGIQLFNLQKEADGSLSPDSLKIVHHTISKLTLEALHSVACIITHNRISFEKTRPRMKNIIKDHLPAYMTRLDGEGSNSQLSQILTNPSSYEYDCMRIATPVTPRLLSSLNQALAGVNALPMQALVAMNRKLREESCPPRFGNEGRAATRQHIVEVIKRRCKKMISKLEEGSNLPKKLAKAMSVVNLCRMMESRSMGISLLEFFPFSKQVISLQNDVLNALWSLEKTKHDKLKLLYPILHQGLKYKRKERRFSISVRRYLVECLFECDEGKLPDEALRVIGFFNRMSRNQAMLTEETMEERVEAILNLSSQLRAIACYDAAGDPIDDQLINLDSEDCSEDNDFVLKETNYFDFGSQQNVDELCSSNSFSNVASVGKSLSGVIGGTHCDPMDENLVSISDTHGRCCGRSGYTASMGHSRNIEAAGSSMEPDLKDDVGASNVETTRCSKNLHEICDETAILADKLISVILKNVLHAENKEVVISTRGSQGSQAIALAEEDNVITEIINAVEAVLPNLSKSYIEKVRSLLNGGKQ